MHTELGTRDANKIAGTCNRRQRQARTLPAGVRRGQSGQRRCFQCRGNCGRDCIRSGRYASRGRVGTWYEASTGRHQLPRGLARRCTSTLSAVTVAPRSSYNSGMRNYLREKAPWWLLVLINGGTFWIVTLVGHALAPSWWPAGYVWSGLTAACFGLVMATLTVKSRQPRSEKDTTDS